MWRNVSNFIKLSDRHKKEFQPSVMARKKGEGRSEFSRTPFPASENYVKKSLKPFFNCTHGKYFVITRRGGVGVRNQLPFKKGVKVYDG